MLVVKFDPWTTNMEFNSFATKPPHLLCNLSNIYSIYTIFHRNITQILKFDNSYLIDNLSNDKKEKNIDKVLSIMYTPI